MKNKKAIFKNFIEDDKVFLEAQSFWRESIRASLIASQLGDEQIKELEQNIAFDRDANPILYQHFPSLNKSIRIIQEDVEDETLEHFGAWVETPDDFRAHFELVISVELTEQSKTSVIALIDDWFALDVDTFTKKLDD